MSVKRANRRTALTLLREQGGLSRKMLAERMSLTPAAITKIVNEMIDEKLLIEGTVLHSSSRIGRAQILVELNAHAYCSLGVLINVGQIVVSAIWLDGSVIFSESMEIETSASAKSTVRMIAERLKSLAYENQIADKTILGLGVAVRGIVDADRRILRDSFGAFRGKNIPLVEIFEQETGLHTVLDNNVRALFTAQMFLSRDRNSLSQFFIRCEYGIGAALSIDNKIWHGGNGRCSEIGHMPFVRRGGKLCSCGKSGCLETVASPSAIRETALSICSPERTPVLWHMMQKSNAPPDLNAVIDAAKHGDVAVAAILDKAIISLGTALKNVIFAIDPQKIVLYGTLFENNYYLSKLLAEMLEGLDNDHSEIIIEKSPYNNMLEPVAGGVLSVCEFFDNGGMKHA